MNEKRRKKIIFGEKQENKRRKVLRESDSGDIELTCIILYFLATLLLFYGGAREDSQAPSRSKGKSNGANCVSYKFRPQ